MHVKASRTIINQGWLDLKPTGRLGNVHTILVLQACSYENQETMEAFSKISKKKPQKTDNMEWTQIPFKDLWAMQKKADKEAKPQEREKTKCLEGRNMDCLQDQAWAGQ